MTTNQSFDKACLAIKYAHDWAESARFTAIIAKEKSSAPAAIYRGKKGNMFSYVIMSGWEEAPKDATLVMIVSATGIERLAGPWGTREFSEAFMA